MSKWKELFQTWFPKGTERTFLSMFGASEKVLNVIWERYLKNGEFKEEWLLWTMRFMSMYVSYDILHAVFNVSYNNFHEKVWKVINQLYNTMDEIDFDERLEYLKIKLGEKYISGIIDATELCVEKPQNKLWFNEVFSGYYGTTTYKYNVICNVDGNKIIHVSGPFKGKEHDLTMLKDVEILLEINDKVKLK